MAKDEITPESINAKKIEEIERKHKEEMDALKNQIQLLQIIATQAKSEEVVTPMMVNIRVTQINYDGTKYFCKTAEEKAIFFENHPGAKKYKCKDCNEKFEVPAIEDGKMLVCSKCRSKSIFVNTEAFSYDLPTFIADPYLNDKENKKHFVRKENKNVG